MLSQRESFLYKGGRSISQVLYRRESRDWIRFHCFFGGDGIILQNSLMKGVEKNFMHIICSRFIAGGQLLQVRIPDTFFFSRRCSS